MRTSFLSLIALPLIAQTAAAQPLVRQSLTDVRVPIESPGATPRQNGPFPPGSIITMRDELENFPVDVSLGGMGVDAPPTSFTGPDGFEWGLNNLRGQQSVNFADIADLSGSPAGGNATRALRLRTSTAQAPGGFFFGATLRTLNRFEPAPGVNTRASAELYISTIAEQYTFETAATFTGFITSRALWGGTCVETAQGDCTDLGLPVGPILQVHILGHNSGFGPNGIFLPAAYCRTAIGSTVPGCTPPAGSAIGDPVTPPIGVWTRWIVETKADNFVDHYIDYLDGSDPVLIHRNIIITNPFLDRVGANTAFQSQDAFLLIDNIEMAGVLIELPKPPPLECPYDDDIEWLWAGPLLGQSARWFAALSSAATIISDGARGLVLSQINNVSSDNKHRREFSTGLPPEHATLANDLVVSFDARFTGATVRAFALYDGPELVARVFRAHEDRTNPNNPVSTDSLFVQTDAAFNPVDDPLGDPDAVNPVIGQHIEDTGVVIPGAQYLTLTLRVSASGALRVYVNDALAYAGPAAFGSSIDTLAFESENNESGSGATLRIDDIRVSCDAPSCATDFDFDGMTGFADLNAALGNFGVVQVQPGFLPGDANGDSTVDFADLNAILAAFGTSCD